MCGALALAQQPEPTLADVVSHLRASADHFEETESVIDAARTHLIWGQVCQARGDPQAARHHLELAANCFKEFGLVAELEAAREAFPKVR